MRKENTYLVTLDIATKIAIDIVVGGDIVIINCVKLKFGLS